MVYEGHVVVICPWVKCFKDDLSDFTGHHGFAWITLYLGVDEESKSKGERLLGDLTI